MVVSVKTKDSTSQTLSVPKYSTKSDMLQRLPSSERAVVRALTTVAEMA